MNENLVEKLINKSKEAYLLAIEIYNKPTIRYRVEGFGFFICNAWELMLKATMISKFGENSIYYKDNPQRSKSLENCVKTLFTNDKDPIRNNLEQIIELRNIGTHYIVEEYEMVYISLFQACVFNYIEIFKKFLDVDVTEIIPTNFLTLTVNVDSFEEDAIRAKYPSELANKLISLNESLIPIINDNNSNFAIRIDHHYYITKDKEKATAIVGINNNSSNPEVKIIKEMKDPNVTFKFTCKKCCNEITKRLKKMGIERKFTAPQFLLFVKYYKIKENTEFCYITKVYSQPQYGYSSKTIDFICSEIKKDPDNIIKNLKELLKKRSTPGAKEF